MRKSIWALMGLVLLLGLAVSVAAAPPGRRRAAAVAEPQAQSQAQLPQAVSSAVASAFPGTTVADSEQETEEGVSAYFVELSSGTEVFVTADGVILEVAYKAQMSSFPAAAAQALQKAGAGATLDGAQRVEVRAEIEGGKAVKLPKPDTEYSATFKKSGKVGEVRALADGTVPDPIEWEIDD